jgi:hypothetical protein
MKISELILKSLQNTASYNKHELAAPSVILWPDEEQLWLKCFESLQNQYPALWSLGEYDPDKGTGPAVWLRFQLETQTGDDVSMIYLPGIGRAAFRSADQFPNQAKHLFALQFQGQFWTQKNGKDWTPFAFLSSADGGLGLDVAADQETKKAIQECLLPLMDVEVDLLRGRKLEAADFRAIVTKDPADTLLRWMGAPSNVKLDLQKSGPEWDNFCAVCRAEYNFDPETEGVITAAEKLTSGVPIWELVWDRYKKAPVVYSGVKEVLLTLIPTNIFETAVEYRPNYNREEEERLGKELLALSTVSAKEAITKIKVLADKHAYRSTWVWAALDEAPLAIAIGYLREMVENIETSGNPSTWGALAEYYSTSGWKVDRNMLRAFGSAHSTATNKAVTAAIRAVYLPWLEKFSTIIQALVATYPTTGPLNCRQLLMEQGTAYIFADGLRMDIARALEEKLVPSGLKVKLEYSWTALPTVTATAKYAWRPLAGKLGGPLEGEGFEPKELANKKAITHPRFKQLLEELGIVFSTTDGTLFPTGCIWSESGSIDTFGHEQGAKMAWRIEEELEGLQERIFELIHNGWTTIQIITDHGWLMMPGGLPKIELPKHLTVSRWGRCAIPSAGAQHGFPVTSWFWDSAEAVVLAPGIACFIAGMEYAHGGLTIQEALIPSLTISATETGSKFVTLKEIKWSGMRLNVILDGAQGIAIDIRGKVADATTSFVASPVTAAFDGQKTSLLVADDAALGIQAFLVVIDQKGQPIFKQSIVIGGN